MKSTFSLQQVMPARLFIQSGSTPVPVSNAQPIPIQESTVARYGSIWGKSFSVNPSQTDYNVKTQQALLTASTSKLKIKVNKATTLQVNTTSGAEIALEANEEFPVSDGDIDVTNLFLTTGAETTSVRVYYYRD
jgi:hypothetical protein